MRIPMRKREKNRKKIISSVLSLLFVILTFCCLPIYASASGLSGKKFYCKNSNLDAPYYNQGYHFLMDGKFLDENTAQASLQLQTFRCPWGTRTFTAQRNTATGLWEGPNVSFTVSTDGYVDNFLYSVVGANITTCQVSLNRLRISTPGLPWMLLLTK